MLSQTASDPVWSIKRLFPWCTGRLHTWKQKQKSEHHAADESRSSTLFPERGPLTFGNDDASAAFRSASLNCVSFQLRPVRRDFILRKLSSGRRLLKLHERRWVKMKVKIIKSRDGIWKVPYWLLSQIFICRIVKNHLLEICFHLISS